jgi:hypothetical protein
MRAVFIVAQKYHAVASRSKLCNFAVRTDYLIDLRRSVIRAEKRA